MKKTYENVDFEPVTFEPVTTESGTPNIRILLVDAHTLFLAGLCCLMRDEPGLTVVGQAVNAAEAIACARTRPDVIIIDLILGSENSLDFLADLIEAGEGARVLVVTGVSDPQCHLRAVQLGAMGVVLKTESPGCLFKAIRKVHTGEMWLNRSMMASAMAEAFRATAAKKPDPESAKIANLSSRERQVIVMLSQGLKNKEIANRLFISEKTVGHHLSSIFSKLDVKDRLELLVYAYRHNLAKITPAPAGNLPDQLLAS